MTPRRPTTVNEFDLFRVTDLLLYLKNNARQPKSTLINLELRHNKVNGELKINKRHSPRRAWPSTGKRKSHGEGRALRSNLGTTYGKRKKRKHVALQKTLTYDVRSAGLITV